MKNLVILMAVSLFYFQTYEKTTLENFVQAQLHTYRLTPSSDSMNPASALEKEKLHTDKQEKFLKARTAHSNQASYYKTVYTRIQMYQYNFDTKEKCRQAQDALLKCFPNDCTEVKRKSGQPVKMTPAVFIFNPQTVVIAKTACEHADKKWEVFVKDFTRAFAEKDADMIVTECGELTWTTKEEVLH